MAAQHFVTLEFFSEPSPRYGARALRGRIGNRECETKARATMRAPLSAVMCPSWISMIDRQMHKPMTMPPSLVVKKFIERIQNKLTLARCFEIGWCYLKRSASQGFTEIW